MHLDVAAWRGEPRARRPVSQRTLRIIKPVFRYSCFRDAYVMRGIGNWFGPVLIIKR